MILSVIILCYNQRDFITQAIESVISQEITYTFELIIGDDSSKDGTSGIIQSYAEKYSFIKYYKHDDNLGLMGNYSFCYRKAKGKYIAVLDGDDYWIDSNKLEKQIALLEEHNDMGIVHTQYDSLYMYPKFLGKRYVRKSLSKEVAKENCTFSGIYSNSAICSSSVCYRKSIVDEYKLMDEFDKGTFAMEDGPIFLTCSLKHKVGYIKESSTVYRVNKLSESHSTDGVKRLKFLEDTLAIRNYFARLATVDQLTSEKLQQNRYLSFAHHYYKCNDIKKFKVVLKKISKKRVGFYLMYIDLLLKYYKIIRLGNILKF